MDINQHNYEAWLLDFIEGRLDEGSVLLLKEFLQHNPNLGDFDDLTADLPSLQPEQITYGDVQSLKKQEIQPAGPVNEINYEQYFIAMNEGLLSQDEQTKLEIFLSLNPFLKTDFDLYCKTKFVPDPAIVYPQKSALKRRLLVFTPVVSRSLAVAASLLLLFSVSWWWLNHDKLPVPEIQLIAVMQPIQAQEINPTFAAIAPTLATRPKAVVQQSMPLPNDMQALMPQLAMKKHSTQVELINYSPNQDIFYLPWELQSELDSFYANLGGSQTDDQKTVVGLILANTFDKLRDIFVREQPEAIIHHDQTAPSSGFSFWNLASIGVKTYNTLTDKDVELSAAHNSNGEVVAYRFRSERLEFTRTLDRESQ